MDIDIDTHIRFKKEDLPKKILDEILDHLKFPNPQKKIAEREMLWGAKNLPDYIELWKVDVNENLILPRGFYCEIYKILKNNNIEINYQDKTIYVPYCKYHCNTELIPLRDYQSKAIEKLANHNGGIYFAPTGSGKTRVMLELIRSLHQKTLIICEKIDIVQQWKKMAMEFGFNIGTDILIELRQGILATLYDTTWYNEFGTIIVDECHHLSSANTLIDLVQRFPARYRFGCSATPDADPGLFPIVQAILGPIVAESNLEEIGDHLVTPSVRVVRTEFEFTYRPTVREGNKVVRNNYNYMMNHIECDFDRNLLIVDLINKEVEEEKYILVVSKRISHLEEIMIKFSLGELGPYDNNVEFSMLTGQNSHEYCDIKNAIEASNNGYVLFSTLAYEGTDIPRLDRLFLSYPGRKLRGYEQAIGRIMRPYQGKKDAIIYDFRDYKVPILNSQFRFRCQNIYHKKGYIVE